ncbi:hypothetical protein PsAD2_03182 [Pseudovibrio axinellae]|uniref:DUF4124 domain-containing protein n=1 Tax=Pseudovibrio axinellae TaxID=989403 RepID=A0A165X3E1_9HYPH|nr:hypothetical protein PsAD2_03182 [Pseudovibrio axinellae]SEQ19863.1 hypothetical protein SAMN05421798_102111 [Pseudovibrio axinellae]
MKYAILVGCCIVVGAVAHPASANGLFKWSGSVDTPGYKQAQSSGRNNIIPPNKPLDRPVEPGDSLRPGQAQPYLPTSRDADHPQLNPPPGAYPPGSARPGSIPPPTTINPTGPLPPTPPIVGLPPAAGSPSGPGAGGPSYGGTTYGQ